MKQSSGYYYQNSPTFGDIETALFFAPHGETIYYRDHQGNVEIVK